MNHGKIAYLKVIDLEKKYHSLHENSKVYDGFLELNKENIDYSFNSLNQATINFPAFK